MGTITVVLMGVSTVVAFSDIIVSVVTDELGLSSCICIYILGTVGANQHWGWGGY